MNIGEIARVCHEVNRAYCESLGDYSQKPWHQAEDWQQRSAVQGVVFVSTTPGVQPGDAHKNWCREKVRDGWVYGEEKDPIRKTHPCILPFNELPEDQQAKDHIFVAIVLALSPDVLPMTVKHKRNPMDKIPDVAPENIGKTPQAVAAYAETLRRLEEKERAAQKAMWPGREAEMRRLGITEDRAVPIVGATQDVEPQRDHLLTNEELMKDTG